MSSYPARIDIQRLEAVLANLPAKQQQVYLLAARDGLSYHDIARRMGLRLSRVERLLARALASIDRQMT